MFLIFGFVYLFMTAGTSTFSTLAVTPLSTFELNFVFLCAFIGFGVKFPI